MVCFIGYEKNLRVLMLVEPGYEDEHSYTFSFVAGSDQDLLKVLSNKLYNFVHVYIFSFKFSEK